MEASILDELKKISNLLLDFTVANKSCEKLVDK
jgi:hypothetical protein